MNGLTALAISKKFTEDTAEQFGAVQGASCQIQSIVKQNGRNTVTFLWKNDDGDERTSDLIVLDGTPIYEWQSGDSYQYSDLVIYASCFYRCITPNSDVEFDATKWNEIGSPDGNYDIVENSTLLPSIFTSADRKMYYSIDDGFFWLWNGYDWVEQIDAEPTQGSKKPVMSGGVYASQHVMTSVIGARLDALESGQAVLTSAMATKQDDITLTPFKALTSDANGKVSTSDTTSTELSYLHGVTGDIQTQLDGGTELLKDTVGWSGKNLLPADAVSDTTHGMTFTVNDDKSITMSGTPDNDFVGFRVTTGTFSLKRGTYTISGAPDISELGDKANLCVYWNNGQNNAASFFYDTEVEFTVNADYNDAFAVIQVSGLYDYGNSITFYPMIRRADITDPTYEPYHAPVQSISDNIAPTESGPTASQAYTAGRYIIWKDGNMYQVTANVSQGTAWAVGTNLSKVTVDGLLPKRASLTTTNVIGNIINFCEPATVANTPGGKKGVLVSLSAPNFSAICAQLYFPYNLDGHKELWARDVTNNVNADWVKIGPASKVPDVPLTEVTLESGFNKHPTDQSSGLRYEVLNGICYVHYTFIHGSSTGYNQLVATGLPHPNATVQSLATTVTTINQAIYVDTGGYLYSNVMDANSYDSTSFSYPVDPTWTPS